jgi:hypothetical protein
MSTENVLGRLMTEPLHEQLPSMKNDICVYMKKRIDIRIDEEKLLIIRAYCERHKKNITAFFDMNNFEIPSLPFGLEQECKC